MGENEGSEWEIEDGKPSRLGDADEEEAHLPWIALNPEWEPPLGS